MTEVTDSKTVQDCAFCRDNQLLSSDILGETNNGYLIQNSKSKGSYLIIPNLHAENINDLPDAWWSDVKALIKLIPNQITDYNLSLNCGEQAGQTLKHLHFWVISRSANEPSSGKGLAGLIKVFNSIRD